MNLPYDSIKVTNSKKTLKYYDQWWNAAYKLITDDIRKVITQM